MFYDIKHDVPVPADLTNDTRRGRTKYPFTKMKPINKATGKGDCIEVSGRREAELAIVRMRGVARERKFQFVAHRERDQRTRKLRGVKIWRVA